MKKLLVLTTIVALAIMAIPTYAAYQVNWTEGFESYTTGNLWGQGKWVNSAGASTKNMTVQTTRVYAGNKAVTQGTGVSQSAAMLTSYNRTGVTYKSGYAKFWVYDPGNVGTVQTDARVGLCSSAGSDSTGKIFTAQIQANNPTMNWEAQWSFSAIMMDGVMTQTGAGYTFTPGIAAPRVVNAWNYVLINWNYAYTNTATKAGSATIKWYVNQTSTPNLTLAVDSSSSRWANTKDIAGVVMGALYADSTPGSFDNFEFHANTIPEPSSLLALGTGMVGLLGLIRRRR